MSWLISGYEEGMRRRTRRNPRRKLTGDLLVQAWPSETKAHGRPDGYHLLISRGPIETLEDIVAFLDVDQVYNHPEWYDVNFGVAETGYGPLLYDTAALFLEEKGLAGLTHSSYQSDDARRIWRRNGVQGGPGGRLQWATMTPQHYAEVYGSPYRVRYKRRHQRRLYLKGMQVFNHAVHTGFTFGEQARIQWRLEGFGFDSQKAFAIVSPGYTVYIFDPVRGWRPKGQEDPGLATAFLNRRLGQNQDQVEQNITPEDTLFLRPDYPGAFV